MHWLFVMNEDDTVILSEIDKRLQDLHDCLLLYLSCFNQIYD